MKVTLFRDKKTIADHAVFLYTFFKTLHADFPTFVTWLEELSDAWLLSSLSRSVADPAIEKKARVKTGVSSSTQIKRPWCMTRFTNGHSLTLMVTLHLWFPWQSSAFDRLSRKVSVVTMTMY